MRGIPPVDLKLEWTWYVLGPFAAGVVLYRLWRGRHPRRAIPDFRP